MMEGELGMGICFLSSNGFSSSSQTNFSSQNRPKLLNNCETELYSASICHNMRKIFHNIHNMHESFHNVSQYAQNISHAPLPR